MNTPMAVKHLLHLPVFVLILISPVEFLAVQQSDQFAVVWAIEFFQEES